MQIEETYGPCRTVVQSGDSYIVGTTKNCIISGADMSTPNVITQVIGHVNNNPTMQLITGITRNTQSKSYTLSLTECVWEFRNNALWDTQ